MPDASITEATPKAAPALKLNFLSHGTLESRDLDFSCKFYEEPLKKEVTFGPGRPSLRADAMSRRFGG